MITCLGLIVGVITTPYREDALEHMMALHPVLLLQSKRRK